MVMTERLSVVEKTKLKQLSERIESIFVGTVKNHFTATALIMGLNSTVSNADCESPTANPATI